VTTPAQEIAFRETGINEGGWYDGSEARDQNPTMFGITQSTYEAHGFAGSVRFITDEQRAKIYLNFWVASQADLFGILSAPLVFDHAFNAGPVAAHKVVQRALYLKDDGVFGPLSREAIAHADDRFLAHRLVVERLISYDDISDAARLRPNLKTWVGRLTDYARKYLRV
jgi:lysozyme family protein